MDLRKPGLYVHTEIVKTNLEKMVRKFRDKGVFLKPHFKTHQSQGIASLFYDQGLRGITVSSVDMASYFATHGWNDITIAFPANPLEKSEIYSLAHRIDLNLVTSEPDTITALTSPEGPKIKWWIKIDVGSKRAGLSIEQPQEIFKLVQKILANPKFSLQGFLGHAGQTYLAKSVNEIIAMETSAIKRMKSLQSLMEKELHQKIKISLGDTPGCSLLEDWDGVDEVRPGNFIFYDLMQLDLGSCNFDEIALAMACPVVEVQASKGKAIIHGGAIHFSKEFHSKYKYGQVLFSESPPNWTGILEGCNLESLSQEHGIVNFPQHLTNYFIPGKTIMIMPIHSCLTVDCMREYHLIPGNKLEKTYRT